MVCMELAISTHSRTVTREVRILGLHIHTVQETWIYEIFYGKFTDAGRTCANSIYQTAFSRPGYEARGITVRMERLDSQHRMRSTEGKKKNAWCTYNHNKCQLHDIYIGIYWLVCTWPPLGAKFHGSICGDCFAAFSFTATTSPVLVDWLGWEHQHSNSECHGGFATPPSYYCISLANWVFPLEVPNFLQ